MLILQVFGDDLNYFGFQKNHFLDEVKQSIELDKVLAKLAQEKNVKVISRKFKAFFFFF